MRASTTAPKSPSTPPQQFRTGGGLKRTPVTRSATRAAAASRRSTLVKRTPPALQQSTAIVAQPTTAASKKPFTTLRLFKEPVKVSSPTPFQRVKPKRPSKTSALSQNFALDSGRMGPASEPEIATVQGFTRSGKTARTPQKRVYSEATEQHTTAPDSSRKRARRSSVIMENKRSLTPERHEAGMAMDSDPVDTYDT